MREIIHVTQTLPDNCTSACLAMITGKSIEEVTEEFHELYKAVQTDPFKYLRNLGYSITVPNTDRDYFADLSMEYSGVYLVTVPSLHKDGAAHHVVFDRREEGVYTLYDPCEGMGYGCRFYVPPKWEAQENENTVELKWFSVDCVVTGGDL